MVIWKTTCRKCEAVRTVIMPVEPRFCIACGAPKPESVATGIDSSFPAPTGEKEEE